MSTTKKIVLEFTNVSGGSHKITLNDIKDNITLTEVQNIANSIITANGIFTNGGDLAGFKEAEIVTTTTEKLQ